MTRKFITISTDSCDWGDTNDAPAFDVNRETAQIRDAAQKHGISVYVDAKPPWDVADLGEEIDWFSTWSLEGYLWGDEQWSDWFANHATITAQDFADCLSHPVVFFAGVGVPGGTHIALTEGAELPFLLDEVCGRVTDEVFDATELSDGPSLHDWKFVDWNLNTIYKIQVFDSEDIWNRQLAEQNEPL